jgi:hypothetical protein
MANIACHPINMGAGKFALKFDPSSVTQEKRRPIEWWYVTSLTLFGLYVNAAVYGFQYPAGADYNLFLPMANWLRDPSLYPGDPIRDAFPHIQTFYWPVVAMLSKHYSSQHILFALFLATKFIFFGAVTLLIADRVRSRVLCACIVASIALSDVLNNQTPIGGTITLDQISEHAALSLAIVLLAGVLLVQGRWRIAAITAGLSVYVDALQLVHMLPAFALLAIVYWRQERRQIIGAALLGAGVVMPWFVYFHKSYLANYPVDYVSVLLIHYPLHITLRWTPRLPILGAATLFLATAGMGFVARKAGLKMERRLELLAVAYLIVMLIGILAGWFWLTPTIARCMLQRADSLLIPYAFLLIQIYGANLLELWGSRRPAATTLLAVLAILLPLFGALAIASFPAMILWLYPQKWLERSFAAVFRTLWKLAPAISTERFAVGLCAVGVLAGFLLAASSLDDLSQLWTFQIPTDPNDSACFDAQMWARDHTPREAKFMVPPAGCGFRVLSQRSSWGEWSDGNIMYFYPAFADTFLKRMETLDPTPVPCGTGIVDSLSEVYKGEPWDRIQAVANENKLDYIVQFGSSPYPVAPVYANSGFAIYRSK